jgi:poly(A) RNA polymerase, mitochondrial
LIQLSYNFATFILGPNDKRMTAEGVNCTFLRDLSSLALSKNKESLESLLAHFFEFYSSFDFGSKGVSLVAGREIAKPEHSPLYIENPLERYLNVSKNVSPEETVRLGVEFRNASWLLEKMLDEDLPENKEDKVWGLLKMLTNPDKKSFKSPQAKSYRLVQVNDLFNEDSGPSRPQTVMRNFSKVKAKRR